MWRLWLLWAMTICCLNEEYCSVFQKTFVKCLFLACRLLFVEVVFEWRGEDDSVIASNQARNGTCRFKKAMMMRWWRRWLGMLGGSIFPSGQGETRRDNYFGAERGSGQNPRVRARQRLFPFRAGQKQCEPIIKCQFLGLFEQMSIFLSFLLVSFWGRAGRGGAVMKILRGWAGFFLGAGWGVHHNWTCRLHKTTSRRKPAKKYLMSSLCIVQEQVQNIWQMAIV